MKQTSKHKHNFDTYKLPEKRFVNSNYANTKTLIFLVYFSFTLGMISLLGGIILSFLFGISATVVPTWISYILLAIAVIGLLISTVLRIIGGSPFYSLRGGAKESYVKSENDITKFRTNHTLDTLLIFNSGLIFFPSFLIWFNEGSKSPYSFILLFITVLISVIGTLFYILIIKNRMIRELGFAYNKNVQELEKNDINAIYIANDPKEIRERILTKESQYTESIKTKKMLAEQREKQKDLSISMNKIGVSNQLKEQEIRKLELEKAKIKRETQAMESDFHSNSQTPEEVAPNSNPKIEFIEKETPKIEFIEEKEKNFENQNISKTLAEIKNEFYSTESSESMLTSGKWKDKK